MKNTKPSLAVAVVATVENPLVEYLAEHADFGIDPVAVEPKKLEAWLAEADGNARAGARSAYLVGRTLRAQRPKHGKVAVWADDQAKKLGRSPRSVRLYMHLAQVIDSDSATALPISLLDRPLREVSRAIQNVRDGFDPDARTPAPTGKTKDHLGFIKRSGQHLVDRAAGLPESVRVDALLEVLRAISAAAVMLPPKAAHGFRAKARGILGITTGPTERSLGHDSWGTPESILEVVRKFAGRKCSPTHNGLVNLDPASDETHNQFVQAERFFGIEDDGLALDWLADFVWLNPPFGTDAKKASNKARWFEKAVAEYLAGHFTEAVVLLPSTNDRRWFQDVTPWSRVDLRDRVWFRGPVDHGAPFPVCLVYLGSDAEAFFDYFQCIGDPVPGVPVAAEMQSVIDELFGHDRRAA